MLALVKLYMYERLCAECFDKAKEWILEKMKESWYCWESRLWTVNLEIFTSGFSSLVSLMVVTALWGFVCCPWHYMSRFNCRSWGTTWFC